MTHVGEGCGAMAADMEPGLPVGKRIKHYRERAGMSRPVLAGLVGKSAEWVKQASPGGAPHLGWCVSAGGFLCGIPTGA